MRASPLNYLLALALGGVLWILAAFLLGNYLVDNVSLIGMTPEAFVGTYRSVLTVGAGVSLLLVFLWFRYGTRRTTAGEMDQARRRWDVLLMAAFGAGVVLVVAMVLLFGDERFAGVHYGVFTLALFSVTWVLFWVSTLLWSPRTVMNVPRGRR